MPSAEGIRLKLRNKICIPLTSKSRGKKLRNRDFTIISNNCWGGTVYEAHDLQKQSPTVGMFFIADDYIKFLKHIKEYLETPLAFIPPSESRWKDMKEVSGDRRFGSYPVGVLKIADGYNESVEVFFLHYHSEEEARVKWERRCKRINWDKMLVKFNDQNACSEEHIKEFEKLPFKNKVCFTVKEHSECKSVIRIHAPASHECIHASYEPFGKRKEINITELLNSL